MLLINLYYILLCDLCWEQKEENVFIVSVLERKPKRVLETWVNLILLHFCLTHIYMLLILLHIVIDLTLREGSLERDYNVMYFV